MQPKTIHTAIVLTHVNSQRTLRYDITSTPIIGYKHSLILAGKRTSVLRHVWFYIGHGGRYFHSLVDVHEMLVGIVFRSFLLHFLHGVAIIIRRSTFKEKTCPFLVTLHSIAVTIAETKHEQRRYMSFVRCLREQTCRLCIVLPTAQSLVEHKAHIIAA